MLIDSLRIAIVKLYAYWGKKKSNKYIVYYIEISDCDNLGSLKQSILILYCSLPNV